MVGEYTLRESEKNRMDCGTVPNRQNLMSETYPPSQRPVALITGAGSGIGRAIALELAGAGLSLALVGRRLEPLHEVAELCKSNGAADVRAFACDLQEAGNIAALVERVHGEMGGPNVLVNNAGIFVEKPFQQATLAEFRESFEINFFSIVSLVKEALPHIEQGIVQGGQGAVIMIGSKAAERGYLNGSIYSATKHALRGFTDSLFYDLQNVGIRVAMVEPGVVNTAMHADSDRYAPERMIQPEDIGRAVRFLLEMPQTACPFLLSVRPQRDPKSVRKGAT